MRTPDTLVEPNYAKYVDGHRQLRVLDRAPSERDNRPLFTYPTLTDEEKAASPPPPWRVLRWHPVDGTEVCATSPAELAAYEAQGYVSFPPNQHPTTVQDAIRDELAGLSAAERDAVLAAAKAARMEALTKKVAGLSDADLALVSAAEKATGKRKAG